MVLAQPDGADDLDDADGDRPAGNEHQKDEGGEAGSQEGEQPREYAGDPGHRKPPARLRTAALADDSRPQRDDAVDQRVGAPQEGEGDQRQAGHGEGQHAEQDRRHPAQEKQPPIVGHCTKQ